MNLQDNYNRLHNWVILAMTVIAALSVIIYTLDRGNTLSKIAKELEEKSPSDVYERVKSSEKIIRAEHLKDYRNLIIKLEEIESKIQELQSKEQ